MTLQGIRLARLDLTVADLVQAARFYVEALDFAAEAVRPLEPAMLTLLGADHGEELVLRRGNQVVALQRLEPAGEPYPAGCTAADLVFQHFAIVTQDIRAAYERLVPFGPVPISARGPQVLPRESGGATAFKFRDPDGHPLELIQFADRHAGGVDHTAIAVADTERSIAFYGERFGLQVRACQVNAGPGQDALDGLSDTQVDVVALAPVQETPHLELLGYRHPLGRPTPPLRPSDLAATRMVLEVEVLPQAAARLADGRAAALSQDPDGHLLVLLEAVTPA